MPEPSELRRAQLGQLGRLGGPALVVVDVQRDFGDPEYLGAYELRPPVLAALELRGALAPRYPGRTLRENLAV